MSIWFKHDAHFHEHPKCLRLRRLAGSKADAAEVGWWRIVAAAKRVGQWTFEDETHLQDAAGRYYWAVKLYREVGLLDDLTIHNGAEYQSPSSGAERVARYRRNAAVVTRDVTQVTTRESRESRERDTPRETLSGDDRRADLEAFLLVTRRAPTEKQRQLLDKLLDVHDVTGPGWAAEIILRNPTDPIGAVIAADKAWREERRTEAIAAEKPKPVARRTGLSKTTREILAEWQRLDAEKTA